MAKHITRLHLCCVSFMSYQIQVISNTTYLTVTSKYCDLNPTQKINCVSNNLLNIYILYKIYIKHLHTILHTHIYRGYCSNLGLPDWNRVRNKSWYSKAPVGCTKKEKKKEATRGRWIEIQRALVASRTVIQFGIGSLSYIYKYMCVCVCMMYVCRHTHVPKYYTFTLLKF